MDSRDDDPNDPNNRDIASLKRALGPLILDALADELTFELALNPDGRLWHEKFGGRMQCIGRLDPSTATNVVRRIAGVVGAEITRAQPLLECELPLGNERVAAQIPPVTTGATMTVRKPASTVFSLEQYVRGGGMTRQQADILGRAIADHRNILVIGSTGSGKTTLLNGLIKEMVINDPLERVVIIEDTRELQCEAENSVRLKTDRKARVDMSELLRTTLRMRPDRILVGEVRGPEALDLLMAWNTGHEGGCATLHANDCESGLLRLATLVSMHPSAPRIIEPLIAEAVHVLVHITKKSGRRCVSEILEVAGWDKNQFTIKRLDT